MVIKFENNQDFELNFEINQDLLSVPRNFMCFFSVPCSAAHYLDQVHGCRQCSEGTYSSGGTTSSCSNCPTGKTVAAGSGTSQADCYWSEC